MTRGRQEFVAMVLPHMAVLHSKALNWTHSRQQADCLLDETLAKLAGEMDEMKSTDNLRLWLVMRLYQEFLADAAAREDEAELLDKDAIIDNFLGEGIWTVSRPN
jgi:DNA-directed RNA polymerase specialized sigma24 family protein